MSGGFRVNGSTGPAPTTAWFGAAIPDRGFTVAVPGYFHGNTPNPNLAFFVADNVSTNSIANWVPFDTGFISGASNPTITLGSTVTAPDGTPTAYHLVETTSNSFHAMVGIYAHGRVTSYRRFAVIAKAAERTRMVMSINAQAGSGSEVGCRTVFDLAGGQIGVANTAYGSGSPSPWVPGPTSIKALGGGWYLCIMDVLHSLDTVIDWNGVLIEIDKGSGTAAINNVYVGDGVSGINVWKTSLLPPRAWNLQTQVFFDDFNSLSTIDVNNTLAPGFNWYVQGSWPLDAGGGLSPVPASALSVNSSILTVDIEHATNPSRKQAWLRTVAWLGGTNWFGQTWQPPVMFEHRTGSDTQAYQGANGWAGVSFAVELLLSPPSNDASFPVGAIGPGAITPTYVWSEIDMPEQGSAAGGTAGILSDFGDLGDYLGPGHGGQTEITSSWFIGVSAWISNLVYNTSTNNLASFGGLIYQSLTTPNQGNPPASSPGAWTVFTPTVNTPTTPNTSQPDYSQPHLWSTLWIDDRSMYDPHDHGELIGFFDGRLAFRAGAASSAQLRYGLSADKNPSITASPLRTTFTRAQERHNAFHLNATWACNIFSDYVRVTK